MSSHPLGDIHLIENPIFFCPLQYPLSHFFLISFFLLYRNRLESNAEHWNALLLSLRELTEWVIRKDTELSSLGLGPVRGDAASLQKQLVSCLLVFLSISGWGSPKGFVYFSIWESFFQ